MFRCSSWTCGNRVQRLCGPWQDKLWSNRNSWQSRWATLSSLTFFCPLQTKCNTWVRPDTNRSHYTPSQKTSPSSIQPISHPWMQVTLLLQSCRPDRRSTKCNKNSFPLTTCWQALDKLSRLTAWASPCHWQNRSGPAGKRPALPLSWDSTDLLDS